MKKTILFLIICLIFQLFLYSCALPSEEPTTGETTDEITETPEEEEPGIGFYGDFCEHVLVLPNGYDLDHSYHSISGYLIYYLGVNEFDKWVNDNEKKGETESRINIANLVKDFNIPREDFQALLDSYIYYGHDYNLDLIYGDNPELTEQYYTGFEIERIENYYIKELIGVVKSRLYHNFLEENESAVAKWIEEKNETGSWKFSESGYIEKKLYSAPTADGGTMDYYSSVFTGENTRQWSICEFVEYFDIPLSVVQKEVETITAGMPYTFDMDRLFEENALENCISELKETHSTEYPAIDPDLIDRLFVTFDADAFYKRIIDEVAQSGVMRNFD